MPAKSGYSAANVYAGYENKSAREKRNQLLQFPRSHAFVIGINHYPDISAHLTSAVPDAERMAAVLWDEQGFDQVWLLRDIRGAEFRKFLEWIGKKGQGRMPGRIKPKAITGRTTPGDRKGIEDNPNTHIIRYADSEEPMEISPDDSLLFYYAGHGKAGEFDQGPSGYLLPSDAKPSKAALQNKSLVPMDDLLTALQDAGCKHTFLILDCCFAGKFRYAVKKRRDTAQLELRPLYAERFERYKRKAAWQVLVSAGPDQTAADWMGDRADQTVATADGNKPHSPFALALFEALAGKAEVKPAGKGLGDGVLTASELKLYLYDQVEKKTQADAEFKAQYPDLFPMQGHLGGEFMFFDPNNPLNFPERKTRNPYKGLKAYEPEDADVFFGRKASVDAAFGYLKKVAVAMVISAPSGLGKSSFARAGLYPKLKNELGFEDLLQMRPGESPKTDLDKLKKRVDPHKKQVLLIDQYEELFTVCTDESQRQDFESGLMQIFDDAFKDKNKTRILITVRSDYEWRLENSELGKALLPLKDAYYSLFRLAPMNLDQLREALVNPALMEAFEFESPQLVDRILQEISFAPGALPLLSLAMKWLFQGVQKIREETDADVRMFTTEHYEQLGGINQCLSKMADAVYDRFDEAHKGMMRNILLRMVQLQESGLVRRRVYINPFTASQQETATHELDYPNDDQDRICRQVLKALEGSIPGDKLEGINLLLRGTDENGREYVEPAHDSLINFWPTCLEWIDAFGKEQLILQRELWRAVEESMQAKTGEAQETDINTQTSPFDEHRLWDTNRKLELLFERLLKNNLRGLQTGKAHTLQEAVGRIERTLSGKDQEAFREFIKSTLSEGGKPDFDALIITGASGSLLDALLDHGDHWLNQSEVAFIRQSWEKRTRGILQLKQERDEARATALIAVARRQENPTIALNLALAAHRLYPSTESAHAFMMLERAQFYQQLFKTYTERGTQSVAFSPDGKHILTGYYNSTQLRNIENQTSKEFEIRPGLVVKAVAISSDGKYILTSYRNIIRRWSTEHDKIFWEFLVPSDLEVNAVVFSPDGNFILTGSDTIRLWDIKDHSFREFQGHKEAISSLVFSPDGKYILTGSWDRSARLWNIEDKTCRVFEGHTELVTSVAFSPCGKYILTGSYDNTARLWSIEDNSCRVFEGHEGGVSSVAYSPDGKTILTGSDDKTARLWNIEDKTYSVFKGHNDAVTSVAFSPDGKSFLTNSDDNTARLWKVVNKTLLEFECPSGSVVHAVAFSPDGKSILTSSKDGTSRVWNIKDQTCRKFEGSSEVDSVALSTDGKTMLTGSFDRAVRLWNISDKSIREFEGPSSVRSATLSPDGKSILTSYHNIIRLWKTEDRSFQEFKGHHGSFVFVGFSPDGKFIPVGSENETLRFWNIEGSASQVFDGYTGSVLFATFSPEGKFVLMGREDKTRRLWHIEVNAFQISHVHYSLLMSLAFSPDGTSILMGSANNPLRVWTLRTLQEQIFGVQHDNSYLGFSGWAVAFSPDGRSILLGNGNKAYLLPNFFTECATGAIWDRCYKLNEEERREYKITWDY